MIVFLKNAWILPVSRSPVLVLCIASSRSCSCYSKHRVSNTIATPSQDGTLGALLSWGSILSSIRQKESLPVLIDHAFFFLHFSWSWHQGENVTTSFKVKTGSSSYVCPGSSCHIYNQNYSITDTTNVMTKYIITIILSYYMKTKHKLSRDSTAHHRQSSYMNTS
jgi:hypothetical protein